MREVSTRFNSVSKSKCHRALRMSAYIQRQDVYDVSFGQTYRYSHKKDLHKCGVIAPDNSPEWAKNNVELWLRVQRKETQKNAQLARHCRTSVPKNIPVDEMERMVEKLINEVFVSRGMVVNFAWHDVGGNNPHIHLLITLRLLDAEGKWSNKIREWNKRDLASEWRSRFAAACNDFYIKAGMPDRLSPDKKSREEGREKLQQHMGPAVHRKLQFEEEIIPRSSQYFIDQKKKKIQELEEQKRRLYYEQKQLRLAMEFILPQAPKIPGLISAFAPQVAAPKPDLLLHRSFISGAPPFIPQGIPLPPIHHRGIQMDNQQVRQSPPQPSPGRGSSGPGMG